MYIKQNRLRFDYSVRVTNSWLANEKRRESLPGNIKLDWELISSIVFCKTDSLRACVHV